MPKRSYGQHCAVARALDLVGERWTLLLVRELLTGPRRYKELQANLPMGTNLLAARLHDLQDAGLVEHEDAHYALTERGAALEESVLALARWGAPLLGDPEPGALWRASWNVVALKYAFRPERARRLQGVIEFQVDESCVQAKIRNGTIETSAESPWRADVVVRTDGESLLAMSAGELDPKDLEARGELEVEGDRRLFRAALRVFAPVEA